MSYDAKIDEMSALDVVASGSADTASRRANFTASRIWRLGCHA
jgi:hypothetical protein